MGTVVYWVKISGLCLRAWRALVEAGEQLAGHVVQGDQHMPVHEAGNRVQQIFMHGDPPRDGRNSLRRPRCGLYRRGNGLVSVNLARRNLTKSQQAMLRAVAYPAPKRGMHSQFRGGTGISKPRLSVARLVFHGAPDWVDLVLAGKSLNDAYNEAQRRRTEAAIFSN